MTLRKPDLAKPAFQIFPTRAERIEKGLCPTCAEAIREEDFRNELSRKEFSISGMCQTCQDGVFGAGD